MCNNFQDYDEPGVEEYYSDDLMDVDLEWDPDLNDEGEWDLDPYGDKEDDYYDEDDYGEDCDWGDCYPSFDEDYDY